jgi:hypothetical protein
MGSGPPHMPSLRELQIRVMNALLGASPDDAIPLVSPADEAMSRLHIYRNNVRGNFLDGLTSAYPVVKRLVGDDYFRQVARDFQRCHPSRSGDLLHAGTRFPDHLADVHAADAFSYLADVARLEWLIQEALLGAQHAPLDLEKMAGVAPSAYDTLCFELHPALRLFESCYPALRIWEANVGDAEPEPIDLGQGGDRIIVMRHRLQLRFHRLSEGELRFLDECRRGTSFAAAVDAADACDDGFDAVSSLQRFVALEAIVDFRSTPDER